MLPAACSEPSIPVAFMVRKYLHNIGFEIWWRHYLFNAFAHYSGIHGQGRISRNETRTTTAAEGESLALGHTDVALFLNYEICSS